MPSRRPQFAWSLAVVLSLTAMVSFAEPPSESLRSEEPRSEEQLGGFCPAALCNEDWDCQSMCSSALTATCVNYECRYTYPGGGGGGGGPFCPAQLCSEDSQCVCGTQQGYCGSDWTCHF